VTGEKRSVCEGSNRNELWKNRANFIVKVEYNSELGVVREIGDTERNRMAFQSLKGKTFRQVDSDDDGVIRGKST